MKGLYMIVSENRMAFESIGKGKVEDVLAETWEGALERANVLAVANPTRRYHILQTRATVNATGPVEVKQYER